MKGTSTKKAAEAILAELPSVLGAYVREDVRGHPREVHLLVTPKPDVRLLSRDVRELLEERLGVPVDQRVISIAQIAPETARQGRAEPARETTTDRAPAEDDPVRSEAMRTRLVYAGLESEKSDDRLSVRVTLTLGDEEYVGEAEELDAGAGRMRAAAEATLAAIAQACGGNVRLDLESTAVVHALGREYALTAVLAGSPSLGRHPLRLAGAHSIAAGSEIAAIFAVLKATNRIVARTLRARDA